MNRYVVMVLHTTGPRDFNWTETEYAFENLMQAHMKAGEHAAATSLYTCVRDVLYARIVAVYNGKGLVV